MSIVIGRIINGEITDGIILNPILNEFYWASKGKGAWCNNKRLRVSKRHQMINCLIGKPILCARYPAKISPKFPVGTEKEIALLGPPKRKDAQK